MQHTLWHNSAGKPLSSTEWLDAHHRAKLVERTEFARRLADLKPSRIVDLGCASGQWLSLLDTVLDHECELVGIDADATSIEIARNRSKDWTQKSKFLICDFMSDIHRIPGADLTLMFNVMAYIDDPSLLISHLRGVSVDGALAVRQYDGFALRFGPMSAATRATIEESLFASIANSSQFDHYSLDRTFEVLTRSPYDDRQIWFELFQRVSPFSDDFLAYLELSLDWTAEYLSKNGRENLVLWRQSLLDQEESRRLYAYEVDLVAILS